MNRTIESVRLLRSKADKTIQEYCDANNKDYTTVRNDYIRRADRYNLKLPIDFYVDYYNLVMIELTEPLIK